MDADLGGGVGVEDAGALAASSGCCGNSSAAPTLSSCVLPAVAAAAAAAAASSNLSEQNIVMEEGVMDAGTAQPKPLTTVTATHSRIPLPWDFISTELCRSCGKPQTELHELFEHDDVSEVVIGAESDSNGNDNRDPRAATTTAARPTDGASADAAANSAASQQHSKMNSILQEMQIWHLGIKFNDGLPQRICSKCTAQFYIIGKFRRKCLKVQMRLQAFYEERRLEEQQSLQETVSKEVEKEEENLNIPPVLDIGNDLINDNYGQPLSEVELFETNWDTEAPHNESLLVDEAEEKIVTDAEGDTDQGEGLTCTDTEVNAAELHVSESTRGHCPDLIISTNASLVNSMDLAVKENIDEESLLDSHVIFRTSLMDPLADHAITDNNDKEEKNELEQKLKTVQESGATDNTKEEVVAVDSANVTETNYSKEPCRAELLNEKPNKNEVEIISVDNSLELLTTPLTSKQTDLRHTSTDAKLEDKNSYEQNYEEQQDCIFGEAKEETKTDEEIRLQTNSQTTIAITQSEDAQGLRDSKTTTQQESFTINQESQTQLNTKSEGEDSPRLSPSNRRDSKEETTKFVSKAALKEYSSSPIHYDVARRSFECSEATVFVGVIDSGKIKKKMPVEGSLQWESVNIDSINTDNSFRTTHAHLDETLKATRTQKRRRKLHPSAAKPMSPLNLLAKHEIENGNLKNMSRVLTRECSVRLCRLSASQLLRPVITSSSTATTTTIQYDGENEAAENHAIINDSQDTRFVTKKSKAETETETEAETKIEISDESYASVSKKPRLSLRLGRRGLQWRTKAEMKANDDLLGLRKSTLRGQLKAAEPEQSHETPTGDTKGKTAESNQPAGPLTTEELDKKCIMADHAKELIADDCDMQEQPITITKVALMEPESMETTSVETLQKIAADTAAATGLPQPTATTAGPQTKLRGGRKSTKYSKLKRKKMRTMNLMKLRQRVSTTKEVESKRCGRGPLAAEDNPDQSTLETCDLEIAADDLEKVYLTTQTGVSDLKDPLEVATTVVDLSNEAQGGSENNESTPVESIKSDTENTESDNLTRKAPAHTEFLDENIDFTDITSTCVPSEEGSGEIQVDESAKEFQVPANPNDIQESNKREELIVRVPLAALPEQFKKLHFGKNTLTNSESSLSNKEIQHFADSTKVIKTDEQSKPLTADVVATANDWLRAINTDENDEHAFLAETAEAAKENFCDSAGGETTQANFCNGAAADPCSVSAGAPPLLDPERAAELINDPLKVASDQRESGQRESDQSDFYGFTTESDATSFGTHDAAEESLCNTSISSQINDYINEFQTHCLDMEDKSEHTFTHTHDIVSPSNQMGAEENRDMQQLPTTRDSTAQLPTSVMDNFVDNTLSGLLNEIQEQSIFSPSTTPIVTMESEDFHNHSSYSPLSDTSSDQAPSTHADFIKSNISDLTDPGPSVNPSNIIDRPQMPCNTSKNLYSGAARSQYPSYVECFAEDSTQSELIGFQNDIPCFENIELSNSTPRQLSSSPAPLPPPVAPLMQSTPSRSTNSTLQEPLVPPNLVPESRNLIYSPKTTDGGSVQYLGLSNDNDLCHSLNTDSMGLVCTTGSGIQMHRPTLSNKANEKTMNSALENDASRSPGDESKEYAVDSATLHLTQIFTDMPSRQTHPPDVVRPSTSQRSRRSEQPSMPVIDQKSMPHNSHMATKTSFSSKLSPTNPTKLIIYPNKTVAAESPPKIKQNPQYVSLHPQSTSRGCPSVSTQLVASNTLPTQLATMPSQAALNTKYTLYTELLPQELRWQPTTSTRDQQTTTTYYINTSDLNQSNLISTTTISVSPIINAGAGGTAAGGSAGARNQLECVPNITLIPTTQLSRPAPSAVGGMSATRTREFGAKRSVDANENYIEGMQNQPIMIVFPQDYMNEAPPVSRIYNNTANQITITPIQTPLNSITSQPQMNSNAASTSAAASATISTARRPPPSSAPAVLKQSPKPVPIAASPAVLPSARITPQRQQLQQKVNLTCRFCHKRPKFTNNLDYSNHIIATHPAENPYNCPHCPLCFTRRGLRQQHITETHSGNRFNCAQCGQSFCAQRTLDLHLQRYHVRTESSATQHQRPATQQVIDVRAAGSQQQADGQAASSFMSSAATTTWHERSSSMQHSEMAEAEKATDTDDTEMATESVTVKKPPHRILGCPDCDDSFDDLANQEPHTARTNPLHSHHHQTASHGCGSANMPSPEQTEPDSTSTTTLRHFRKQRDTPERVLRSSHNCLFCDEHFINDAALRKHQQAVHGGQSALPFVCSTCKRGFRMRTALQRHMETHDGAGRPYECSICLVRFPRPSQLTLHKLTVHFLKKPHVCRICDKQFGTESALQTHEKFHGAHIKTHIPHNVYTEGDPPSVEQQEQLQQEPHELEQYHQQEADPVEFNDISDDDTEMLNPQNSST